MTLFVGRIAMLMACDRCGRGASEELRQGDIISYVV